MQKKTSSPNAATTGITGKPARNGTTGAGGEASQFKAVPEGLMGASAGKPAKKGPKLARDMSASERAAIRRQLDEEGEDAGYNRFDHAFY
jgi:hypothetical protein